MFAAAGEPMHHVRSFNNAAFLDHWIRSYLEQKRKEGPVLFLDSQLEGHASSTQGYIATDPVWVIRIRDGYMYNGSDRKKRKISSWDALKEFRSAHPDWMFGWLAYDLKNDIESLVSQHKDPVGLPDLFFFVPGVLLRIDRSLCRVTVIKGSCSELEKVPNVNLKIKETICAGSREKEKPGDLNFIIGPLKSGDGQKKYYDKVDQIKKRIAQGDTYEVNLTHQLRTEYSGNTLDLFEFMRKNGPVPFGAWIHYEDVEVCCASPERFLQRKGNKVRSQPIKGTSPRGTNPKEDARIVEEILQKEKNRAENVMIVDLVRHDLGQIARTGTVRTESLLEVQSFSTVHQLVSTITAEIMPERTSTDVIKACFPMGSMTGAPKIRTMQIIEEIESYRRGLYSGAIGYFTPEDDFDFNVVIRTAIIKKGKLFYSVGGAITADSDPVDEWNETWLKAETLPLPRAL